MEGKQLTRQEKRRISIIPFITTMFATLIAGALMALVDKLWDRPVWIDWIHPGVLFAVFGGLTAGITDILTMAKLNVKKSGSPIYSAVVFLASCTSMMIVWNKYSCNGFNKLSGPLTLIGFIVFGFLGIRISLLCSFIKKALTGKQILS